MARVGRRRRGAKGGRNDRVRGVRAAADRPLSGAPRHCDVAVVGGGPAGCAAAIVLARSGAAVVVLERSNYDGRRIGETLPPEVRPVLESLGAWDRFRDDGHIPTPGILAAWGQPEPYANDFIVNPFGAGWCADRNRFDAMLAAAAADAGAGVFNGTNVDRRTRSADGRWELAISTSGVAPASLSADFVVDATGRSPAPGPEPHPRRILHDRLVALVSRCPPLHHRRTADRRVLIEATEEGWWYSATLPDDSLLLSFQTDAGPRLQARWDDHLAAAPHTAARAGTVTAGRVEVVPANSFRTVPVAREGWMAVGDAAGAHDPLCGLGIHWALESGIRGAAAILSDGGAAYDIDAESRYDRYLVARSGYYRSENRWPEARFWRRRRAADR